ncbi:MAG: phosphoglycerate dehydrogenase [Acidobacteria bacterium RIFCSPLOWO2_12_FULL_67_14b]|nr:MAG: phosphoglycerate dehydrogenase [Acidobacteria bacterium RIFCSPLOWO2_12_FULL_67_14b]
MLIVVADDLPKTALELLRAEGWTVDARSGRTPEQLAGDLAEADALVVRSATKVTPAIIAAAPKLRAIARAGTGVDNVNVEAASARGIVVMNAPGANSISVAELAMAQLLSLARKLPAADASMKQGKWDKKSFLGEEVRGKVLGLAGLGRIGQEVARRAHSFKMIVIAHDPFISAQVAAGLGVELVSFDDLCARADYLSVHMPSTPQTKHTFNAVRLAACKKGLKLINTARGDLIDEAALAAAIQSGQIGGAALDVFAQEPTTDHTLQQLPQVVASPHIAASTREGQELVGVETASALRDFLKTGVIRNAVNFPSVAPEEFQTLQPYMALGKQLGCLVGQMGEARIQSLSVRYYGELASGQHPLIANAVLVGLFQAILSDTVTEVNARAMATIRGIELTESASTRSRNFRSLLSVLLTTSEGKRWVEGTVSGTGARLVLLNGVPLEAPLGGTLILLANHDKPGVIGEVGTILGRLGINIANITLGRSEGGAVGVVNVDEPAEPIGGDVLQAIRAAKGVKAAWLVRV